MSAVYSSKPIFTECNKDINYIFRLVEGSRIHLEFFMPRGLPNVLESLPEDYWKVAKQRLNRYEGKLRDHLEPFHIQLLPQQLSLELARLEGLPKKKEARRLVSELRIYYGNGPIYSWTAIEHSIEQGRWDREDLDKHIAIDDNIPEILDKAESRKKLEERVREERAYSPTDPRKHFTASELLLIKRLWEDKFESRWTGDWRYIAAFLTLKMPESVKNPTKKWDGLTHSQILDQIKGYNLNLRYSQMSTLPPVYQPMVQLEEVKDFGSTDQSEAAAGLGRNSSKQEGRKQTREELEFEDQSSEIDEIDSSVDEQDHEEEKEQVPHDEPTHEHSREVEQKKDSPTRPQPELTRENQLGIIEAILRLKAKFGATFPMITRALDLVQSGQFRLQEVVEMDEGQFKEVFGQAE